MPAAKPLKQLLAQADELIKSASVHTGALRKEASAHDSEVLALADLLTGASTDAISEFSERDQESIDKVAESLNRVQAAQEIEELLKLAQFKERAHGEGYSDDQIQEAFSKIAASKLAQSLPTLVSLGLVGSDNGEEFDPLSLGSDQGLGY